MTEVHPCFLTHLREFDRHTHIRIGPAHNAFYLKNFRELNAGGEFSPRPKRFVGFKVHSGQTDITQSSVEHDAAPGDLNFGATRVALVPTPFGSVHSLTIGMQDWVPQRLLQSYAMHAPRTCQWP